MQMSMENKVHAGFFVRLVAYIIDSLIALALVGIVKFPLWILSMYIVSLKENFLFQYSFIDVCGYLGVLAYFTLMTYYAHATLGKKLLRLEVVTVDGEWTLLNILYRESIGRFLSAILNIGYLAVIVTEKKQGFHDMLADTYVVYKGMEKEDAVSVQMPAVAETTGGAKDMSEPASDVFVLEETGQAVDAKSENEEVPVAEEFRQTSDVEPENEEVPVPEETGQAAGAESENVAAPAEKPSAPTYY